MDHPCKWCDGTGAIAIEPNCSTRYRCTDCEGTGRIHDGEPEPNCEDDPEDE